MNKVLKSYRCSACFLIILHRFYKHGSPRQIVSKGSLNDGNESRENVKQAPNLAEHIEEGVRVSVVSIGLRSKNEVALRDLRSFPLYIFSHVVFNNGDDRVLLHIRIEQAQDVILQNYDVLVDIVLFCCHVVSNLQVCEFSVEQVLSGVFLDVLVL